jgi:hypothetical protein
MALSGSWVFGVTRDDIIKESMQNVGALGESEIPTSQEVTDCSRKLNMMVKQWMGSQDFAPGLKMWERQRGELFLTSSQGVYELGPNSPDNWAGSVKGQNNSQPYGQTILLQAQNAGDNSFFVADASDMNVGDNVGIFIGPDIFWSTITSVSTGSNNFTIPGPGLPAPTSGSNVVYNYTTKAQRPLGIVTCILRDQFGQDTPVNPMTIQEYEALPTKTQQGYVCDAAAFYYESQFSTDGKTVTGGGLIFLDMFGAQDTNKHLHIVYVRPVMDMNQPTDNPEYPQQWYRALCWGLAREIAPMFDSDWTQEMQANYDQSLLMAREGDPETTALYFQPNVADPYGTY